MARATAAGLDVGAVISGINQPLPLVRFQVLAQKATEICQEVKSLGNNLLSAIEKEDNEALAMLRANHERLILGIAESVKYAQWQEAIKTREGLEQSLMNAAQRYIYYERQLGKKDNEIQIPQLDALDKDNLLKMKFQQGEPSLGLRPIDIDIAQDLNDSGGKLVSSHEAEELENLGLARDIQDVVRFGKLAAQGIRMLPDFGINFHFWGLGGNMRIGGTTLGEVASYAADVSLAIGERLTYEASTAAKIGSYARREQEWAFQSNTIAGEITQTLKQLRAAQIREAIAEREWKNHQTQIKNAEEIQQFLKGEETQIGGKKHKKVSTQAFYTWMKREVKGLYGQCFQFAFDTAKKAERALQHELGKPELSFLQFGYLSGKEGLLAGEKLYLDIKRMEMAYHDLNQREYELTKHVSLLQVNPLELLKLRTTGRCTVTLPEELFDMDCPGHYFRRIKNVAVSIPCVTGSYTSVNCTLTLTKSSIRKSSLLGDDYARVDAEDSRFSDYFGSLQSIVTSSGQNDSGLFETNLRDDRYLPFEGSGVVSEWQLQLPANPSNQDPLQFDYDTISDVILHLRYTAREGGGLLKNGAIAHLKNQIDAAQTVGSVRLFSMRHDFCTGWAKFKSVKIEGATTKAEINLEIGEEHFPYWSKGRLGTIEQILVHAKTSTGIVPQNPSSSEVEVITQEPDGKTSSQVFAALTNISLPQSPNKFRLNLKLSFNTNLMEDLWLTVTWGKQE